MNLYVLIVALVALVGLLAYALSSNKKIETIGIVAFAVGLLVFLQHVVVGGRI